MNNEMGGLVREGFQILATTGGPLILALLVVGLIVGVFQATTQINDPSIGFLPRMAVALLGGWALGGWMLERCAGYLAHAMGLMSGRM